MRRRTAAPDRRDAAAVGDGTVAHLRGDARLWRRRIGAAAVRHQRSGAAAVGATHRSPEECIKQATMHRDFLGERNQPQRELIYGPFLPLQIW